MKIILCWGGLIISILTAQSQVHTIDLSQWNPPAIREAHLKLGGQNAQGENLTLTNYYLSINGQPSIPITGEFHYSRYPRAYWEESLLKMKAGGVTLVATYVFWNMHEEKEGEFVWTGERDLRYFLELCKKHQLRAVVRIGPFGHGEIRSGGLPDWLMSKPFSVRSNDAGYLTYVERLYKQIGHQLRGLLFKEGGPVWGIQLENEYQHSSSPWGLTYPGQPYDFTVAERDINTNQEGVGVATEVNPYAELGTDHLRVLKALAIKAGLDVPLYTATGWGNAAIIPHETLPVTAAYAYPTWTVKKDLSPFFLYTNLHQKPDYAPVRYTPEDYPYFCAELSGGIMTTYSRRPRVPAESMDALVNRCLGSGANGIGYYMYHGGSTPKGTTAFFNDEAYGYPKISYDFQAPIGEYGELKPSFHRLKLLHFFTNTFGATLAPMAVHLPDSQKLLTSDNITNPRYSVRSDGHSGFLFLNNFQDDTLMNDQQNLRFRIRLKEKEIQIPEHTGFTLKSGENAIFPFQLNLSGVTLLHATAQVLTRLDEAHYIFFAPDGIRSEFSFLATNKMQVRATNEAKISKNSHRYLVTLHAKGATEISIRKPDGKMIYVLVLEKSQALGSWIGKVQGENRLLVSKGMLLTDGKSWQLHTLDNTLTLQVYPALSRMPTLQTGIMKVQPSSWGSAYQISFPVQTFDLKYTASSPSKFSIQLPGSLPKSIHDLWLSIDYLGDTGMMFQANALVADEFYKGIPWSIGLRQFIYSTSNHSADFYFRPLSNNATYLADLPSIPDFGQSKRLVRVKGISIRPEYQTEINF